MNSLHPLTQQPEVMAAVTEAMGWGFLLGVFTTIVIGLMLRWLLKS